MQSGQCMELVTGGSDMWIFIVFVCVTVTAIIIFVNYRRTKKTMDTIEEMLNVAVKGEFTEGQFDETRMSALETKFAHYLSASALSAQNVEAEKDKIKALIADISHQTKTPIANLLLYSELLLEEELPQQNALQLGAHLLDQKWVVRAVGGLVLGGQDELATEEAVRMVIQRGQRTVADDLVAVLDARHLADVQTY